ncbi:transcriptional regulator [Calothrix sp. NIES-4071]|nr:transcriptional regulator [Calothrix sp. NIES-4071]BAZ59855.1 transcriptional regulator [Calothrix sp. NIES-4105]
MGRPTKENSLTRQDVIEAAISCLEKEGEAALGVNRVARELGIKPPAIYKHLDGNTALRKAVVLEVWQKYLTYCHQQTTGLSEPREMLLAGGRATRNFARMYPAFYRLIMQYQLQPSDPDAAIVIQKSLSFLKNSLRLYELNNNQLIDVMRMVNAAISGFISIEQAGLMTLERSTDESYEVMLDAILVAIEHIRLGS